MEDQYVILGISPQASADEIKSAYRRCVRQAHPDHNGTEEKFHAVQAAYALLSDPEKRARYDAQRRAWMAQIGAVECMQCGHPNRLLRRPPPGYQARCWHCKAPLTVQDEQIRQAERQAVAKEVVRFLDEVAPDLADLAVDGVRRGLGRVRRALGLGPGARRTK